MKHINQSQIERYEELQAIIKQSTSELNAIKAEFMAGGGGESDSHIVVIKDNFRELVASKSVFEKKFGPTWLKDNGLINLSAFNTVVIAQKSIQKVG